MMSTSTSGILPTVSSSSAFPTCCLQPRMDNLLQNDLVGNVLWEETDLPATTSSLMDHIIPKSSIHRSVFENITYVTGVPIFVDHKWQLDKHWNKQMLTQKQKQAPDDTDSDTEELGTDCEGSSASGQEGSSMSAAPDASDQGWDSREYDPNQPNRKLTPKRIPEQKWARLFNTVYMAMHMTYRVMFPHHSPMYPFEPADRKCPHRQWSPEFCNAPILDVTNIQKPGVVLLDRDVQPKSWAHVLTCVEITESDLGANHDIPLFKGVITKGYLMILAANHLRAHYMHHSGLIITCPILITANPTCLVDMLNTMSLGNNKFHGMDSTMHMCNESCKQTQCEVGDQAIGWIEDKEKQKLLIIAILWRSQGLFSCRTICYHVDEAKKDHEEKDVEFEGEPASTLCIRNRHGKFSPEFYCKYHRHMLLTPCGEPLSTFLTKRELISTFRDLVIVHKAMTKRKVLHRDLSPNNLIIYKGRGFFIDFDHAQIIAQCNTSVCAQGTCTLLYMSIYLLRYLHSASKLTDKDLVVTGQIASHDLESLFYIFVEFVTTYDGPHGSRAVSYKSGLLLAKCDEELMNCTTAYFGQLKYLIQEWRLKFLQAVEESCESGIHHEDIEEVLVKWIYHEAADEPLPVAQASSLSPVSILPLPVPRHSNWKTVPVKRP
ncbi:uncharacterized protein EDB91DRAFT_1254095 [Suillus paluster]|uniref:uncharacterized protein n=1 Tax=Suillus paluster TaxID=48578 RepID=UPI001B882328|nr:uncharacterized protein EDB91DRAFT_1254095 [Suillus paluster]KAG1726979.1 hypothetical protein EDB91DRAFT_1254095 [Suillus paluster]